MTSRDPAARRWPLALAIGVIVLAFTRVRARIPIYRELHVWLAQLGVPDELRNLDAPLLMVVAALLAARLVGASPFRILGLRASLPRGLWFGLLAGAPMVIVGAVVGSGARIGWDTVRGVLVAPFVEEVFFRGLLVAIPVAIGGRRFWPFALLSSALFGALHVPWDERLSSTHVFPFLITAVGGLWYAWLLRVFAWNLWHTISLHAVMNAAWMVFAVGGGAVGSGVWPNVGRGLTIALGTVIALRHHRSRTAIRA